MPNVLRTFAVKAVKPLVSDTVWERLRATLRRQPASAPEKSKPPTVQRVRRKRLRQMNLTELAKEFKTDKAGIHQYTQHYEQHLKHLKSEKFTLLELGIGGYARKGRGGASLRTWKHFFPKANIVGLDIQDKAFVDAPRIRTYKGSQVDEQLLRQILADAGEIGVVIDDGSHRPEHIRESFRILFPLLRNGGVYAIEDTQTSYWPEYGGSEDRYAQNTTMSLVKDLVDGLNYEEYVDDSYEPTYTDLNVVAVHAYHNLVFIEKGINREGTNRRRVLRKRYKEADAKP